MENLDDRNEGRLIEKVAFRALDDYNSGLPIEGGQVAKALSDELAYDWSNPGRMLAVAKVLENDLANHWMRGAEITYSAQTNTITGITFHDMTFWGRRHDMVITANDGEVDTTVIASHGIAAGGEIQTSIRSRQKNVP